LDRFQYTDVHKALKEVPGVQIQEEDGHGLRPNIAIRGGRSDRSADITVMEDNVLIAPAPYSAPAAYYFPQMDRIESLEVIKGTGAVKYGPRTTNGILNMVTKPIPNKTQTRIIGEAGSYGTYRTGITTGTSTDNVGVLLNAFHKQTEGFKDLDFVGDDTGYNVEDIMGKIRFNSNPNQDNYQEFEIKLGHYDETSNETYLGLTDADFAATPNRRYGSSQLDEMNVDGLHVSANHYIELSPELNLNTTLYNHKVDRSWYKLDAVRVGGVSRSLSQIFADPTTNAAYVSALKEANTAGGTFVIRDNNRKYESKGVQAVFDYGFGLGETQNKLEFGFRYHQDEEDRFQRDDRFDLTNGVASITTTGAAGAAGNRILSAKAYSTFLENEIEWDNWTITPGVRFEHINLRQDNFGNADPSRTGAALTVLENDLNVVIPGIGVSYKIDDSWNVLAGVHKGFAPPGVPATAGEAAFSKEEESINYELGTRYSNGNWQAETFAFFNDYDNLLGRDTLSSGGGGSGESFNGGQVEVKGLEAVLNYNAASIAGLSSNYTLPVTLSYTRTDSKFKNSFVSTFEEWQTVTAGEELPYTAKNQLYIATGLETDDWGLSLGGKYVSDMRSTAGSGPIPANELIEAHWVLDAAAEYKLLENVTAFTTIDNLLDETYVAARRPAGSRPGMPLTVMAGLKVDM
jgi:Fe(3+) dicitrate transport protein